MQCEFSKAYFNREWSNMFSPLPEHGGQKELFRRIAVAVISPFAYLALFFRDFVNSFYDKKKEPEWAIVPATSLALPIPLNIQNNIIKHFRCVIPDAKKFNFAQIDAAKIFFTIKRGNQIWAAKEILLTRKQSPVYLPQVLPAPESPASESEEDTLTTVRNVTLLSAPNTSDLVPFGSVGFNLREQQLIRTDEGEFDEKNYLIAAGLVIKIGDQLFCYTSYESNETFSFLGGGGSEYNRGTMNILCNANSENSIPYFLKVIGREDIGNFLLK